MIIRSMTADFGRLEGETLELEPGLNVIARPNESGKSTWCAFIRAMLYGIDTSERVKGGFLPDKLRYAPWSGAPMSGTMELEYAGREITLTRWTKSASSPMREFRAVYSGTAEPVPGLTGASAGEALIGAGREIFRRSAFIGQGEAAVTGSAELERRIASVVSTGEEGTSCTEALSRLGASDEDEARDRMYFWDPPEMPGEQALLALVDLSSPLPEQPISQRLTEFARGAVEENLLSYVRAHRETTFTVFFPPYSLLYWANEARNGEFETRLAQKELLMRALIGEENVRLFDFQTHDVWVRDYSLYYDLIHYTSPVNDAMATAMAQGTCLIDDASQIGAQIDALRQAVYALFDSPPMKGATP